MSLAERLMSRLTEDIYVELKLDPVAHPPRTENVIDLLIARGLAAEAQEAVYVVAIDPEQVRRVACVAKGDYHSVTVSIPAVLAIPLLSGASEFIVAHNHPGGRLLPTKQDFDMTDALVNAANVAGLIMTDHIIVAPDGRYMSFREANVLEVPEPRKMEVRA